MALRFPQIMAQLADDVEFQSRFLVKLRLKSSGRNFISSKGGYRLGGVCISAFFGQSNQIAGSPNGEGFLETANNRRLELQIRFTY